MWYMWNIYASCILGKKSLIKYYMKNYSSGRSARRLYMIQIYMMHVHRRETSTSLLPLKVCLHASSMVTMTVMVGHANAAIECTST